MRKDFFGIDTDVGDFVVFNEPNYKSLISGIVAKITPKGIKVKYTSGVYKLEQECFVYERQFVRYPETIAF